MNVDYFDPWRTTVYDCPSCKWHGPGSALRTGDVGDCFWEMKCPKCREIILLVLGPTIAEIRAHWSTLSEDDRRWCERLEHEHAEFERCKLRDGSQLPDIAAPWFLLKWDVDHVPSETLIKYGERVIFREPGGWEDYERFIEVAEILRRRYGTALWDLVPTAGSLDSLWGDSHSAEAKIALARERIFGVAPQDMIPQWGMFHLGLPDEVRRRWQWQSVSKRLLQEHIG